MLRFFKSKRFCHLSLLWVNQSSNFCHFRRILRLKHGFEVTLCHIVRFIQEYRIRSGYTSLFVQHLTLITSAANVPLLRAKMLIHWPAALQHCGDVLLLGLWHSARGSRSIATSKHKRAPGRKYSFPRTNASLLSLKRHQIGINILADRSVAFD